ncbi:hypothetical protein ACFPOD_04165 [Nitratireductor kimnyeongensis]|uniref:Uncharacterized protein n=1 Tax=Nitratireductor kimnyeongensis TaxID=430679 RepID=A0ABW0T5R6_9HYPH|nr:hypothetical protein [Nitratireductor kimnyeongensis]QZZ34710.1 hypothetical protein KW403_13030 [Nitratireductor kimnyeongensis]
MALTPLKRTALIFAVFNLVGISILAWLLKSVFDALYTTAPQWLGITLSFIFVVTVIGVNVWLSRRAYRIDSGSILTRLMIAWTLISAVSAVVFSALDPWNILKSLAVIVGA